VQRLQMSHANRNARPHSSCSSIMGGPPCRIHTSGATGSLFVVRFSFFVFPVYV
jgi:hypothetical protein